MFKNIILNKLALLIPVILLYGCSNIEKKTHEALLTSENAFMDEECQLNKYFIDEPEFYTFSKTEFCSGDIEITQLENISDNETIVDYQIIFKAKQRKLKKWLRAYKSMESRKLPSSRQEQVKVLIEKITKEKRNWAYTKQTVKLNLTDNGWVVEDVIR